MAQLPFLHLYALWRGKAGLGFDSEAHWLRWGDVDLDADVRDPVTGDVHDLTIVREVHERDDHRVKPGKGRDVPMTPRQRDAMRGTSPRSGSPPTRGTPWGARELVNVYRPC